MNNPDYQDALGFDPIYQPIAVHESFSDVLINYFRHVATYVRKFANAVRPTEFLRRRLERNALSPGDGLNVLGCFR